MKIFNIRVFLLNILLKGDNLQTFMNKTITKGV